MKKKQVRLLKLVKKNVARLDNLYSIKAGDGGNNTETEPVITGDEELEFECINGSDEWVLKPKKEKV